MHYLIIGHGAAGYAAAEAIRWRDTRGEITILTDEKHPAYYRPLIPYLLYEGPEAANLYRDAQHTPPDINVRLGVRVRSIAPHEKQVTLDTPHADKLAYDKLLLATGASALRPPIEGIDGPGVFTFRNIDDISAVRAAARQAQRAVVIGGGFVGVKAALALRRLGLQVTIVEILRWIVPQQFDVQAADILQTALQAEGIEMLFGRVVRRITRSWGGKVKNILFDDGTILPTDLVVVSVGVKPNVELARAAGIRVQRGVQVNARLETSAPDVYAAGDAVVVETEGVVTGEAVVGGIWTNAVAMGHVAGENMAGGNRESTGALSVLNASDIAGIPVVSVGVVSPRASRDYQVHVVREGSVYRKLVLLDNALVGLLFLGDVRHAGVYTALIRERADIQSVKEALLAKTLTYAHRLRPQPPTAEGYAA